MYKQSRESSSVAVCQDAAFYVSIVWNLDGFVCVFGFFFFSSSAWGYTKMVAPNLTEL